MTSLEMAEQCPSAPRRDGDVTWLLHRAGHRLRVWLDDQAERFGLGDSRDWAVLTAIRHRPGRAQLAIGAELGLDKTTLTSILDRLENRGFVVRATAPTDRRVKVPQVTDTGKSAQAAMEQVRDEFEDRMLSGFPESEKEAFLRVLTELAQPTGPAPEPHGSCM